MFNLQTSQMLSFSSALPKFFCLQWGCLAQYMRDTHSRGRTRYSTEGTRNLKKTSAGSESLDNSECRLPPVVYDVDKIILACSRRMFDICLSTYTRNWRCYDDVMRKRWRSVTVRGGCIVGYMGLTSCRGLSIQRHNVPWSGY